MTNPGWICLLCVCKYVRAFNVSRCAHGCERKCVWESFLACLYMCDCVRGECACVCVHVLYVWLSFCRIYNDIGSVVSVYVYVRVWACACVTGYTILCAEGGAAIKTELAAVEVSLEGLLHHNGSALFCKRNKKQKTQLKYVLTIW